jgi:hypothetical protein
MESQRAAAGEAWRGPIAASRDRKNNPCPRGYLRAVKTGTRSKGVRAAPGANKSGTCSAGGSEYRYVQKMWIQRHNRGVRTANGRSGVLEEVITSLIRYHTVTGTGVREVA